MREKLFGFQEDALSDLHKRINSANSMLLSDAEEQVIISFSAPTGSGKTIVMTALFEEIFYGSAETQGDPNAIIVWLSDMPELNEQSRRKIESKSVCAICTPLIPPLIANAWSAAISTF